MNISLCRLKTQSHGYDPSGRYPLTLKVTNGNPNPNFQNLQDLAST